MGGGDIPPVCVKINKESLSVEYFSLLRTSINMQPDKYIRGMIKDSQGYIYGQGGFYSLKCFDLKDNSVSVCIRGEYFDNRYCGKRWSPHVDWYSCRALSDG